MPKILSMFELVELFKLTYAIAMAVAGVFLVKIIETAVKIVLGKEG